MTAARLRGPRRGAGVVVALFVTASLALAGCSGGEEQTPAEEKPPAEQEVAEGISLSGRWPLTGLPASGAAPKHPAMVVKIDNSSSSEPQVGLRKADLVVEELVEGGSTRLAVFYYSKLPKVSGPVRSMRATDIGIVQPAEGVLIASGGAPPTVRRVAEADIRTFTEGATGYFREGSRSAPYNLMMRLPALAKKLKTPQPPPNYLPWGEEGDFPQGSKATTVAAQFSGGHTTSWEYQGGSYDNLNSYAARGDRFSPETLVVLRVPVGDAGYLDPAGNPVPETKFVGKGDALLFNGGRVVKAEWSKSSLDDSLDLTTRSGEELTLPPGKAWIELVPKNGGDVRYSKN